MLQYQDLENSLREKLNALPDKSNRLLYDIDYDESIIIEVAKHLLAQKTLSELSGYRLTILAAFASAMANDEYAELDSFYNRLFDNFQLHNNQQNSIRDFVEDTCSRFNLRFLKNENRLVRNTIWLHGGIPSKHWQSFFERVLMPIQPSLENLDALLNPPTPKSIKRFFDLGGNSARSFLIDCIEMRDALSARDESLCAGDFGVSELFFARLKEFLETSSFRKTSNALFLDCTYLKVIQMPGKEDSLPERDIYVFNQNGKASRRGEFELPKRPVILVHHKKFAIPSTVPRFVEPEALHGAWKDYRCEWLNLHNQTELVLEHGSEKKIIYVIDKPDVKLLGNPLSLSNRAVYVLINDESIEVYAQLPELVIENISESALSKMTLSVKDVKTGIDIKSGIALSSLGLKEESRITLSSLGLKEGVYTIQMHGARGLPTLHIAYFPGLELRLDKNEYLADEKPVLSIGKESKRLEPEGNRANISYRSFHLSIPIPIQAWCTDKPPSSQQILLPHDKLPDIQGNSFLNAWLCTNEPTVKLCIRNQEHIIRSQTVRIEDAFCRIDLAPFRDIAKANLELDFLFQFKNGKTVEVLKTYNEWKPEISPRVEGKTVSFDITDNARGFTNRRLVLWNRCRLWEKPIVLSVPDDANTLTHTFEHDGEYIIMPHIERMGWKSKEFSTFDIPSKRYSFRIGNITFKEILEQRTESLLKILLDSQKTIGVQIDEYIAVLFYMEKTNKCIPTREAWLHLFVALPESIRNRFIAKLYDDSLPEIMSLRSKYEEKIIKKITFPIVRKSTVSAIISHFPIGSNPQISISLRASQPSDSSFDGLLDWETNATQARLTGIQEKPINAQGKGKRAVRTDSIEFYTLIAHSSQQTVIATVGVAREPLILCFHALQLDNSRFKLIWRVLNAHQIQLSSDGNTEIVDDFGTKGIEPSNNQTFTLTATSTRGSSQKTIRTVFAPPHIETFIADSIHDGNVKVYWKTLRADNVRIEPYIGKVDASGEIEIPIDQLQVGITLVAVNKSHKVEKNLKFEIDELPDWFRHNAPVKIKFNRNTFYATVKDILFGKTGQLTFSGGKSLSFEMYFSCANRVYVGLENFSPIIALHPCSCSIVLSNFDEFIAELSEK